jgi:acylphosphatase
MTMPNLVRIHARVYGLVQGVSFRYYTLQQAQSLDVTGWVRNMDDGSVEVVAEGENEAVQQLLSWLHHGPPSAEVENVDLRSETPQGKPRRFEVRL